MRTSALLIGLGMSGAAMVDALTTVADEEFVTVWLPGFHFWPKEVVTKFEGAVINIDDDATTVAISCPNSPEISDEERLSYCADRPMTVTLKDSTVLQTITQASDIQYSSKETDICILDPPDAECTIWWSEKFEGLKATSSYYLEKYGNIADDGHVTITKPPGYVVTAEATTTEVATTEATPTEQTEQTSSSQKTPVTAPSWVSNSTATTPASSTGAQTTATTASGTAPAVTGNAAQLRDGMVGIMSLVALVGGVFMLA